MITYILIIIVVVKKVRSNWSCPNNNKIWDQVVYQNENSDSTGTTLHDSDGAGTTLHDSDGAGTTLHDSDGAGTTLHVNQMAVILLTCSLLLF